MEYIIFMTFIFGLIIAFLYCLKRLLDADTYTTLTNKIVAFIVNSENTILGYKKGEERLVNVIDNITKTASQRELKLLKKINIKTLVSRIFTTIALPIIFKKVAK